MLTRFIDKIKSNEFQSGGYNPTIITDAIDFSKESYKVF